MLSKKQRMRRLLRKAKERAKSTSGFTSMCHSKKSTIQVPIRVNISAKVPRKRSWFQRICLERNFRAVWSG